MAKTTTVSLEVRSDRWRREQATEAIDAIIRSLDWDAPEPTPTEPVGLRWSVLRVAEWWAPWIITLLALAVAYAAWTR